MDHRTLACATAFAVVCGLLSGCSSGDPSRGEGAQTLPSQVIDGRRVDPALDRHLDKTPPRKPTGLRLRRVEWTYDCMECHRLLKPRWHHQPLQGEHRDLELRHGANRFCLNCHHPTNRNVFVDYDGSEIPPSDVVRLCAKCHGPTYRDWKVGVHGRRNGYWNTAMGPQTRLSCIECHDPHAPRFQSIPPMPGPHYPVRAPGALDSPGAADSPPGAAEGGAK